VQNFSPRFEQMGAGVTGPVLLLTNGTQLVANLTDGRWNHEVRHRRAGGRLYRQPQGRQDDCRGRFCVLRNEFLGAET
jgi:hypothetical protein